MEDQERLLIDINTLNGMPVNEKAKEMLGETGIKPDPASLYYVQLAQWGYEKGGIEVEDAVLETIKAMLTWRPARIANFFMIDIERLEYGPQGWQKAQMPLDLAQIIINDIEEKIRMHFPLYGSVE
ncbi:MAG: hypothetical protein NT178_12125 [Proteobacteria bacterium]|nr:hypothetical protein [Pseudomonadota bacterium]